MPRPKPRRGSLGFRVQHDPTRAAYWINRRGYARPAAIAAAEAERVKRGLPPLGTVAPYVPGREPLKLGFNPQGGHVYSQQDQLSRLQARTRQALAHPDQAARLHAVILRRQGILRDLGLYDGPPDGVWGPKSQHAWTVFVYRRQHGLPYENPVPAEQAAARASHVADLRREKQAALHAAAQPGTIDTTAAAKQAHALQLQRVHQLSLQGQTLRSHPERAASLDLHGLTAVITNPDFHFDPTNHADTTIVQSWLRTRDPKVVVDGVWGRTTNDALTRAYAAQRIADQRHATQLVVHDFYGKGGLIPGSRPGWWPLPSAVPKPGALLAQLQHGGFGADLLMRSLTQHTPLPAIEYAKWRHQQLERFNRSFDGPLAAPDFLAKAASARSLTLDLEAKAQQHLSGQSLSTFHAEISALWSSKTAPQFQRQVRSLLKQADADYRDAQAHAAKHHSSWWGSALHYATVPGVLVRQTAVQEVLDLKDFFAHPVRAIGEDPERRDARLNADAKAAIKGMNPIERFVFELAVDPLIFLRPVRLTSSILRATRVPGASGLGRYVIGTGEDLAHGLRYDNATWHLPLKGAAGTAIRSVPGVAKALALKEVAVDRAAESVAVAARHAFEPVTKLYDGLPEITKYPVKAAERARLAKARAALADHLEAAAIPKTIQALKDADVSLYLDATKTRLSQVGSSLLARHAEEIRVQEAFRFAVQSAQDVFHKSVEAGALHADSLRLAEAEFARVKDGAGLFIAGHGDPAVLEVIDKRVSGLLQQYEEVVIPAIQHALERHADAALTSLFDDAGLWAARHTSAAADTLRAAGHESFGVHDLVPIPNPRFNVPLDVGQMVEAVESEYRRVRARLVDYHARERMAGRDFTPNWLEDKLTAARADIESHFRPVEGGRYADTRDTLEVSALYARNYQRAMQFSPTLAEANAEQLVNLASRRVPLQPGALDAEIAQMVWDVGSAHYGPLPRVLNAATTQAIDFGPRSQIGQRTIDLVAEAHVALAKATTQALPHALADNWALMAALAKAQSLPLRVAYKGLNFATSGWIFATLPLRTGWVVRNVGDNLAKSFVAGVHDPRAYFLGAAHPGSAVRTIFDLNIKMVSHTLHFLDAQFGTEAGHHFDQLADTFWQHSADTIRRVLDAQGLGDVPEQVIESMRFNPFEQKVGKRALQTSINPSAVSDGLLGGEARGGLRVWPPGRRPPRRIALADEARSYVDAASPGWLRRRKDGLWHLMANHPEDYFKRVIYRDTLKKGLRDGLDPIAAHDAAWAKVEATLFDYGKITVVEDNFRLFFPFVQFWRKNTGFWVRAAGGAPWLPYQLEKFEQAREQAHSDWPDWMRRYVSASEITDATAAVPGLGWLAQHALPQQGQYDPLNFLSFAPLYRVYEQEVLNGSGVDLPPEKKATLFGGFFGGFIDALNDWGLGVSPFLRKPLESAGIANYRSWQSVFPQTGLAAAFTRRYFGDELAGNVVDWERVFTLGLGNVPSDEIAKNFDQYVSREIAGQAARGEPLDRAAAERTIRAWFWEQNLYGYFAGLYFRKNTPEDFYLAKLHDSLVTGQRDWATLTEAENKLEGLWKRRKLDRLAFDRYVEAVPGIEAYFKQGSYAAAQDYARGHPEILPYVDPLWARGRPFSDSYVASAALYLRGAVWFDINALAKAGDLPHEVKQAAASQLITPALQEFWARSDTPAQIRNRQIKGEMYKQLNDLAQHYFGIPGSDHAARDGFLAEHPQLAAYWQRNNSQADDYRAIVGQANADLRSRYFEIVKDHGWDAATSFLTAHPFIFEWTSAAAKVDQATGTWIAHSPKAKAYLAARTGIQHYHDLKDSDPAAAYAWLKTPAGSATLAYFRQYGKHGTTQKARDYLAAKSALDRYHRIHDGAGGPKAAAAWLRQHGDEQKTVLAYFRKYANHESTQKARDYLAAKSALDRYGRIHDGAGGPAAAAAWLDRKGRDQELVRAYFKKYAGSGGKTDYARAFLRAKPYLKLYHDLAPADRGAWLRGGSKGAGIVLAYFEKWGHPNGLNAHAHAFLQVKPLLDRYHALPRKARAAWLNGPSADAAKLLAFFKTYGTTARLERAFRKANPQLASRDPELSRRLDFWRQYFNLTPDLRPKFVLDHAEEHGVFVFGAHGEVEADSSEQKFIRAAMATKIDHHHLSEKQATFLYVKPLVDEYYALPKGDERDLFLRANPELADYLTRFAHTSITGNKALDAKVEAYFTLPPDSLQRSQYLYQHPEVQVYFDQHSTPAERAIRSLLNVYFSLAGRDRHDFAAQHPEISAYFDRRRKERGARAYQLSAFEHADPSLRPFYDNATGDIAPAAERMAAILRNARLHRLQPATLARGPERHPLQTP